jgi:hypothetical protein
LEQKAPARAGLAYPHKIISTWLARQQRRRCPSRFLVKPGGTESEATKSDLDAMKSNLLLAPSAIDFLRHQWPVPSVQKPNKYTPSAIKKSPINRKQVE